MVKTHAEKIREAVTNLGNPRAYEIIEWLENRYSPERLNRQSYRADIIGCSINHSSSHHYPNMPKFLWFDENSKRYRLANPEETPKAELHKDEPLSFLEIGHGLIDGVQVSKLGISGQVKMPSSVCEKLGLRPGDLLAFFVKDDLIEIRKAKIKIEFE